MKLSEELHAVRELKLLFAEKSGYKALFALTDKNSNHNFYGISSGNHITMSHTTFHSEQGRSRFLGSVALNGSERLL